MALKKEPEPKWGIRMVECSEGHKQRLFVPIVEGKRFTYCIGCGTAREFKVIEEPDCDQEDHPKNFGTRYIGGEKMVVKLSGEGGHYHNPRTEIENFNAEMKAKRKGLDPWKGLDP